MRRDSRQRGARTWVFVYGTLLRGEPNHHLLEGATFKGAARTWSSFSLHDLGAFPGMVEGGTHAVEGEVYEVDEDMLATLDHLEGVPRFYQRVEIMLEDGSFVETYVLRTSQVRGRSVIRTGNWRTYREEKMG